MNVREATKVTTIPRGGGPDGLSPLLIKKGMGIGFSPYHMHRDKDIYGPDASEFRPERWEGPDLKNIGLGFMPFHAGPRICLGSKQATNTKNSKELIVCSEDFALTEASFGIVRILQTFPDMHLPPGFPIEPLGHEKQELTVVVSSADGCKVILR